MSNIENLQSEFENLIAELEKLKSVNEFAATNTESAQNVIELMTEFVERTKKFESKITDNYEVQKKEIAIAVNELSAVLLDTNYNNQQSQKIILQMLNDFAEKQSNTLFSFEDSQKNHVESVGSSLESQMQVWRSTKLSLERQITKTSEETKKYLQEENETFKNSIEKELSTLSKMNYILLSVTAIFSAIAALCSLLMLL